MSPQRLADTTPLRVGDLAPDFDLPCATGERVRLADLCRSRLVVVSFYPRDDTPLCTRESCAFRDAWEAFADAGAEVVGISTDPPERHRAFSARHGLPFLLLSDSDGSVAEQWGVSSPFARFPGRATFVVDRARAIRHIYSARFRAAEHAREALATVRRLAG